MASMEMTKIAAGVLCAGLLAMVAGKIAGTLVHPEQLAENAYKVDVSAIAASSGAEEPAGPAPIEPIVGLLADTDPADGQKLTRACASCHSFDEGGPNKVGPNLWDIVNADKGAKDGFNYSDALANFAEPSTWTYASLNAFLLKPKDYIPGTKMSYAGMKKTTDRAKLVAYLRSLSASPAPLPSAEEIQAAEEAFKAASGG